MEISRVSSQAQWYTSIGTMANLAEYGLEFYRRGDSPDKARELTLKGIELCQILVEGTDLSGKGPVSPQQLNRLKAIEPLLSQDIDPVRDIHHLLKDALDTLRTVVRDLDEQKRTVSDQRINEVQELLRKVGQIFSIKAFSMVTPRESKHSIARTYTAV